MTEILDKEEKRNPVVSTIENSQPRSKEKSERSWWRKTDDSFTQPEISDKPPTPTTPTSPAFQAKEQLRYDFFLQPRPKLLTLNDVFDTPKTILWSNTSKFSKEDFYRDTIKVSWDQTDESKRKEANYSILKKRKLEKMKETHTQPQPSKVETEFTGMREVPHSKATLKKNGDLGGFIPRKDAQEFRPALTQEYKDYFNRHHEENSASKRAVKPDSHHLPSSYMESNYSEYTRESDYPPMSMQQDRNSDMYYNGVPDSYRRENADAYRRDPDNYRRDHDSYRRDDNYRRDPAREAYASRQYEREAIARRYYEKERQYNQNQTLDRSSRDPRERMYDMTQEEMMHARYAERRRRDDYSYQVERDSRAFDRIATYDEYSRVMMERNRALELRRQEQRRRMRHDPSEDVRDPRTNLYYRMKQDMLYNDRLRSDRLRSERSRRAMGAY